MDSATLPVVEVGDTISEGDTFTVRGENFSLWPDDIVLAYNARDVYDDDFPSFHLMKLSSKTDDSLVFEATETQTFSFGHVFNVFGTPTDRPREVLEYMEM